MKIHKKNYSLYQLFSCLIELVYISFVFQSLVYLTFLILIKAFCQIRFVLKLFTVSLVVLLFDY